MSEAALLTFAEQCAETARRAEVELLRVAYQWAVLHNPDRLGPTTDGHFQVRQPFPGISIWRDPHGHYTLVDHTGTRPLPGTPTPGPTTTAELYRPIPDLDIDLAA